MRVLLPLLMLGSVAHALYFFLDGTNAKCFFEELPKDTLVLGHYQAEEWDDNTHAWAKHDGISIYISVDPRAQMRKTTPTIVITLTSSPGNLRQRPSGSLAAGILVGKIHLHGGRVGRAQALLHAEQQHSGRPGWLSAAQPNGGIKLTLDLAIGSSEIESTDKTKLMDISQRIRDLNARLQDIRREQIFQREREAEFRDQSESTNSRVVRWMTIQLVVLGITCAWQLSHLRSFFIKQKLT
ncbi:putative membrane protein C16E9.09c [Daldinia childiae]|uniref:putative membrane protein C16E9.09c n=1 Tax=Daldinia childiae TaxID=326645 RepID=UPI0014488918|nr:putative membrane protein C16E9.09c [Daldinia childiae]KAF3058727.1 putative membrane protein C16E9.09c [Daldinia childiae]